MALTTRFRALMKSEVAAVDVEALLRGAGQLEVLREEIQQRRDAGEVSHPGHPWEVHAEMGRALAFFWVAQGYAAIARSLKEVDDESDPGTRGYMSQVSHDQAMALLRQVPQFLASAHGALADVNYDSERSLPVGLEPRVDSENRCPVAHLKGMLRAAHYLDEQAQVEVKTYCSAGSHADAPAELRGMVPRLEGQLAAARSNLDTSEQAVSPILNGEAVDAETHEQAENYLWASLETYVRLGQIVALPTLIDHRAGSGHRPPPKRGRRVSRRDAWCLTSDVARKELKREGRDGWGEDELDELWSNKQWRISADEQRFLDGVARLNEEGAIMDSASYIAECPFNSIWVARRPVTVMGCKLKAGSRFAYNHHHGKGELLTNFQPVGDFLECEDDD